MSRREFVAVTVGLLAFALFWDTTVNNGHPGSSREGGGKEPP